MKRVFAVLISVCVLSQLASPVPAEVTLRHKWVYVSTNLLVRKNVDELMPLMERIKRCGYTGILLADSKFTRLAGYGERYFGNARRVIAKAKELDLEIIPAIFPIGYAGGLLSHDVNLIEGVPVVEAPFEVRGGKLVPVMPAETKLVNGDFEEIDAKGRLNGWWQENVGGSVHVDREVVKSGRASVRMEDIRKHSAQHGHCRLQQPIKTQPFQYYHLSVWIRTEDFENPRGVKMLVLAKGKPETLSYKDLGVKRTQDWTRYDACFNSLENTEVRVYCGVWSGQGGKLWWDDLRMEPGGFVNVIRREACPVKLTSADRRTPYVEGRDVARIVDPKLGNERYPGTFAPWHTPPEITVPDGSRLREGDRVLASCYHPMIVHHSQVACSLADPKLYDILDDQMRRVHALFGAKHYMMSHDEIRVGGWTPDYDGKTMGEWLAMNVRRCRDIVKKHAPDAKVYVWSDMFDPNHNARADYYLVKTPWAGSWKGLTPDVVMMDWYAKVAPETMKFFHDLGGHEQIMAGYYDGDVPANVKQWMEAAKASPAKVTGIMYTTWRHNYDDLEKFMEEVKKYE